MPELTNKVVVITGANSGIGEAAAVAFVAAGATVYGIARRKEALTAARTQHPKVKWLLADVAKEADVTAAIGAVVKEAGRLDVLVNNAGVALFAGLEDSGEDMIRTQLDVNVLGVALTTRAALAALKTSRGTVINISSTVGHKPAAGAAIYAATKAAIESLTKSWALELAPHGVRVNAVAPGPTETAVFSKLPIPADMVPQVKAQFVKQVPLGRIATAAEIAHWIVAIADSSVTWMTGNVIAIDGGMSVS